MPSSLYHDVELDCDVRPVGSDIVDDKIYMVLCPQEGDTYTVPISEFLSRRFVAH